MKVLELRIHPPIILLLSIALAYLCRHYLPLIALPVQITQFYWYLGAVGVLVAIAGIWQFRQASTTIDPAKPQKTSQLVTQGVYRFTRNPMYLGMVLVLIAAIVKLASLFGFIALITFILYITQFQIKPEERVIEGLFGKEYLEYKKRVRRWL